MEALLKYDPPDHIIILKAETDDEDNTLRRFHIRPGTITTKLKSETYQRYALLEIRKAVSV